MQQAVYQKLAELEEREESAALVTIVRIKGSSPGKVGFKMLVDSRGNITGTVGGGVLEAMAICEALEAIRTGLPKLSVYRLTQDKAENLGMLCGGEVTYFVEAIVPAAALVIVGAGHISQTLAIMGKLIGFRVMVLDDREEFCNRERFPTADSCLVGEIEGLLDSLPICSSTCIIIVTRGHTYDRLVLAKMVGSAAGYLGMIGSKYKVEKTFSSLLEEGYSEEMLGKVYAPIGLNIAAKTPQEIAVSILAEIIAVKNKAKDFLK